VANTRDDPQGACIFCRVVAGELPSKGAYSTELTYAFHDLNPVAPLHVLVVPRAHIADCSQVTPADGDVLADMIGTGHAVAQAAGVDRSGYRLVFNIGNDAGAEVAHLHLHVVGGRKMGWPPG
jgi:histidine triad (HIT) family protein